jgi:rhamnulose-1-phosphate aldolase
MHTGKEANLGLDRLIAMIGQAGKRLSEIEASEGAAGNMSVCVRSSLDVQERFPQAEELALPMSVPELAGATFIVTGSGRPLRDVLDDPEGNLGCLVVQGGGRKARLHTSRSRRFTRLTSEFHSHLAVHQDRLAHGPTTLHAVLHAQPPYLTYLSHIAAYQSESYLNRRLLRWEPETIVQMPEGLAVVPFLIPGSAELVEPTREALTQHQLALWSRHGVMARSDGSVQHACDLIEYAEAAARYEYMNLVAGEPSDGLSAKEIRAICASLNVKQAIF